MPDGVPPFAIYDPGADTHMNSSRRQSVRAVTVHTTQGNDSRGLGKNRHHNSPGTFNFLVRDEALYCYYPAWVRCSHAAGANYAGPGIENEGFTGTPMSDAKLDRLGQLAHWLNTTYGVPLTLYDGADIAVDNSGFKGFVNHNSVATEPQYQHTDRIPPEEWARAIGSGGGAMTGTGTRKMIMLFVPNVGYALWSPPSAFEILSQSQFDNMKEQGLPGLWTDQAMWNRAKKAVDDYWKLMFAGATAGGGGDGGGGGPTVAEIAAGVAQGVASLTAPAGKRD